jgi:hypothetical protein
MRPLRDARRGAPGRAVCRGDTRPATPLSVRIFAPLRFGGGGFDICIIRMIETSLIDRWLGMQALLTE